MLKKNKKIKIAVIGIRGIPALMGGAEAVVENITTNLVKHCEITVFCRKNYNFQNNKNYQGIKLRYVPTLNSKHLEAIVHTFFCSIIACFSSYDIIHYHSIGPSLFSFLPRIFGKKVISTCHGLDWQRSKWHKFAKIFLKLGEKSSSIFPNITTVVSLDLKKYYQKKYQKKTVYIKNGVNLDDCFQEDNAVLDKFNLEKNDYILFLSRLVPEKRVDLLIDAYLELDLTQKLVIVGDSSHSNEYVQSLFKKASSKIIFTGALFGKQKNAILKNSSLFVLPSDIEGMPIVLLEALASNCVCLASDLAVHKLVLKDNIYGETFIKGNKEDLKQKIIFLLANQEIRSNFKQKAKDYVVKHYNWQNIAKKYFVLYKILASK